MARSKRSRTSAQEQARQREVAAQAENRPDAGPAEATAPEGGAGSGSERTYRMLNIGIGKAHKATHDSLLALGVTLHCAVSALVWDALERYLKTPPTSPPEGAAAPVGTAAGWWVVATVDGDGRATGVAVVEVAARGDAEGLSFFRYNRDKETQAIDAKSRTRALKQAARAARQTMMLAGLKGEPKVTNLA